jgi:hypothetical protein
VNRLCDRGDIWIKFVIYGSDGMTAQNFKTETDLFFNNIYEECFYLLSDKPSKQEWLFWASKFKETAGIETFRKEFLLKAAAEFEAKAEAL